MFISHSFALALTPTDENSVDVLDPHRDAKERKALAQKKKEEVRKANFDKVKKRAVRIINSVINKLNRIRDRVNNMPNISDDAKGQLNLKIDARIAVLEEKKSLIDTATTKAEIKKIIKEVKTEIARTRDIVKEVVVSIHKTHLENIVERLVGVIVKIEKKIEGWDESRKTAVEGNISKAKSSLREARELLKGGKLKQAKAKIKEAHDFLVDAISSGKDTDGDANE